MTLEQIKYLYQKYKAPIDVQWSDNTWHTFHEPKIDGTAKYRINENWLIDNPCRSPEEWNKLLETNIIDWDGFRDLKYEVLMTKEDFEHRAAQSTRNIRDFIKEQSDKKYRGDFTFRPGVEQPPMTLRQEVLEHAIQHVTTIKQDAYGKPEDSFAMIADFWNTYLRRRTPPPEAIIGCGYYRVTPKDVSIMMLLLKVAREAAKHKIDNLIDAAGYSACAAELAEKENNS